MNSHSIRPFPAFLLLLGLLLPLTGCGGAPSASPTAVPATPTAAPSPRNSPPPSPTPKESWSEQSRLSRGVIIAPPRFSPDGSLFAVPTSNGISVYETGGWSLISELRNEELDWMVPSALAFSSDGKQLAAAYARKIRLWQPASGQLLQTLDLGSDQYYATSLDYSPDGRQVAAGLRRDPDLATVVFQTSDWQPEYTVEGSEPRFSPDSQRLATVSAKTGEKPYVSLYTAGQGQLVHRWDGQSAAFLPGDELLIEANGATRVVDTRAEPFGARLALNGSAPAVSPDGRTVAVYEPGFLRVYDLADGRLLQSQTLTPGVRPLEVDSLLFSPDGQRLVASTSTRLCDSCEPLPGPILLWQVRAGESVQALPAPAFTPWLSFDPQGRSLVVTIKDEVRGYDAASGAPAGVLSTFSDYISELALSPDGSLLTAGYGETGYFGLRAWELATQSEPRRFASIPQGSVNLDWWKMAFSPDGRLVALGGNLWQVETGLPLASLPLPSTEFPEPATTISLAFAPDGRTIALGLPKGEVQFWELGTLTHTHTLVTDFPGDVVSLAYAPDGSQLAAATAYTYEDLLKPSPALQVWQMPAGSTLRQLPAENIAYATYSPKGQMLATLSVPSESYQRDFPYGVVQLWSEAGELLATLPPDSVVRLAFAPDGESLALGLGDGHVQLWSLDAQLIQELDTSQSGVISGLAFTPDGRELIIASGTGVIEVWSR